MKIILVCLQAAMFTLLLTACDNTNTVSLKVQNNQAAPVNNLTVGSVNYGLVASGATSSGKDIEKGTHSVTSDTVSGSVEVSADSTLVISSTGTLSIQ